jgi:hypothetical protein
MAVNRVATWTWLPTKADLYQDCEETHSRERRGEVRESQLLGVAGDRCDFYCSMKMAK